MSSENVDLVRRAIDAFNRADIDEALSLMHPDVEWHPLPSLPDSRPWHGREGVRAFWQSWRESFGDFTLEVDEYIDEGDRILAVTRAVGRGTGSGAGVESPPYVQVIEVRDGTVASNRMFPTMRQARAAAGLSD